MSRNKAAQRLASGLRKRLKNGWSRAVFAPPEGRADAPAERVVQGPGAGAVDEAALEALIAASRAAAGDGLVKQTFVLDESTRLTADARFGALKKRELDAERLDKITGGKRKALLPDASGPLLRAIGIMNADGTISAKNAKKYKQVNHLVELLRPAWTRALEARSDEGPLRVLDAACGNGYLTFVLCEALRLEGVQATVVGVDVRDDLVQRCRQRAEQLGFERLRFERATIAEAEARAADWLGGAPELVLALHACDTATDEALALALRQRARAIFAVPCCQRELAAQLEGGEAPSEPLVRFGLMRREYGALLTDALRAEVLEAFGYRVDAVEFTSSEHTPKNLLLRASAGAEPDDAALATVRERARTLGVDPALLRLLS